MNTKCRTNRCRNNAHSAFVLESRNEFVQVPVCRKHMVWTEITNARLVEVVAL